MMRSVLMRVWIILALALVGSSNFAEASRSRLLVMGAGESGFILGSSGNEGSFFYDDAYNVFYNPALISEYTDWAIIEKSNFSQGGGQTAQGGFFSSILGLRFGLYLNRTGGVNSGFANSANFRPIDFFIGSGEEFKWGLGLTHGAFRTNGASDTDFTVRAGLKTGASLELFGSASVIGQEKSTNPNNTYRNFLLGTKYQWGEWIPYLAVRYLRTNTTPSMRFGFGLGREFQVASGVSIYHAIGYWRRADSRRNVVPFELSAQGKAVDWLTLRAGLSYRIADRVGDVSSADSTTGRLGATFHVGSVDFDWSVGRTGSALESGSGLSVDYDSQNFDLSNGFFTTASLSYAW